MSENSTYKRTVLYSCDAFEVVAGEWNKNCISLLHNHEWSQCAVLVQEGVFENRTEFGLKSELSIAEPGQIVLTPVGAEHEFRCLSEVGKTLHVYMPRIDAPSRLSFASTSLETIKSKIDIKLSNESMKWADVLRILNQIRENAVSTHSPFFMNQLFSGVFAETLVAEQMTSTLRTTMATFEASPSFTAIEIELVDKLCELIGWKTDERDGLGVPGGSAANIMAVHCARQKKIPQYRKIGPQGERFKIFCSVAAHYSMQKACIATGLGTDALIEVTVDHSGRMQVQDLKNKIQAALSNGDTPLMICATSGTTVFGAFDPIDELADICESHGIWLHVDAAWGGPVLFSKNARALMSGSSRADSMTFDAHKLFGSNLTASFFLTRQRGILLEANDVSGGDYIFHSDEVVEDRGRISWQCGRGPDAFSFWTLWKSQGTDGLGRFVDRLFDLRDECVDWIKKNPRFELIANPTYLNICVRVTPPNGEPDPAWSKKVRDHLKQENIAFVNFSTDDKGTFLRLILAHPKLKLHHVTEILTAAIAVR